MSCKEYVQELYGVCTGVVWSMYRSCVECYTESNDVWSVTRVVWSVYTSCMECYTSCMECYTSCMECYMSCMECYRTVCTIFYGSGSVSYRPSASPSYEASSHVNNYAYSGKLLLLLS